MSNEIINRLNTLNQMLTLMQREVVGAISAIQQTAGQPTKAPQMEQQKVATTGQFSLAEAIPVAIAEVLADKAPSDSSADVAPVVEAASAFATPTRETVAEEVKQTLLAVDQKATTDKEQVAKRVAEREAHRLEEMVQNFTGINNSIFIRYMSPAVMDNARGFLKPGECGMEIYQEDITQIPTEVLLKWPSGFYRDRVTKGLQFYVRGVHAALYLDSLPSPNGDPIVIMIAPDGKPPVKRSIRSFNWMELASIRETIERALLQLIANKNQS